MKALHTIAATLLVSALACTAALAQAPGASGQADMRMTGASRQQLIDRLAEEVTGKYAFPDMANKAGASLRARHKRGAYDGMTSARQLSEALTQELQATTGDRHLRVSYSEEPIPASRPQAAPTPEDSVRRLAIMRSGNFGVKKIEHLPFNIGYLELEGFAPAQDAADTLAAAMTVLAHTDALVIDLRNNSGGDAATVTLLASYLFDKRTRLNDFYYREGDRLEQRWSADVVPGLRYGQKKDVYILTSRHTFSAAEDFAYALKNLKRATIVGETSSGGANPGMDVRLLPNFSVFLPLGRAVSPVTKTNWEGVGVKPDVAVCAADAMRTAQVAILARMAQSENDTARAGRLRERIAELGAGHTTDATCP
ncbi:MAG: S41 family peptidase [Pseudomonadota bacterium]